MSQEILSACTHTNKHTDYHLPIVLGMSVSLDENFEFSRCAYNYNYQNNYDVLESQKHMHSNKQNER